MPPALLIFNSVSDGWIASVANTDFFYAFRGETEADQLLSASNFAEKMKSGILDGIDLLFDTTDTSAVIGEQLLGTTSSLWLASTEIYMDTTGAVLMEELVSVGDALWIALI